MSTIISEQAYFEAEYASTLALLAQNLQQAQQAAQQLCKWARQSKNPEWLGLSLRVLAKCQKALGQPNEAIASLQASIRHYKRHKLMPQAMQSYDELANLLHEQLAYYPALDAWLQSLEVATVLQASYGCIRAYLGIGKVHFAFGDYRKAMHFHQIAHNLSQPLQDKALECELNLNLAADAYRLGKYQEALSALEQISAHLPAGQKQPEWEAEVLTYNGLIQMHFEHFSEAQELLSQAYLLFRKHHLIAGQGQVMLALATCFAALQQADLAEECLQEAARLSDEHQLLPLAIESHTQLAKLYLDTGQYQAALSHRKRLHELVAGQHDQRGFPMQLSNQTKARLRRIERELETRKSILRLQSYVA